MMLAERWFADRGWTPFPYQREAWAAFARGEDGLVHAPTGTGKTLAAWFGPLEAAAGAGGAGPIAGALPGPRVIWLTPLRALASDTVDALERPLLDLGLPLRVERRTGDTGSAARKRQRDQPPFALVTTPESLSVLLSYAAAPRWFRHVQALVVDEWHELIGTKRGVQAELALAAVRAFSPTARTWGLSATIGNLSEAARVLAGHEDVRLIEAEIDKRIEIRTLIPAEIERFPWSGHLGTRLIGDVAAAIRAARSTLLFTNTRSQAEIWFRDLLRHDPDLLGALAMHHGSLDRSIRHEVERLLAAGRLKGVVCTSSLDLGIDLPPVDQVIQIGSPKGIARLRQRAGRSGHQPGAVSRIVGVPTNALELVEFAAARDRLETRRIEARTPLTAPVDVLVQHVVTRALGGGFEPAALLAELRGSHAYRDLHEREFRWVLDFVIHGGQALGAYPEYCRVVERDGRCTVESPRTARRHRLSIGTITSDVAVSVRFRGGRSIGTIEESFIARLRPGDHFVFAGRALELLELRDMTAVVRPSRRRSGRVPRWVGGRSPLSTQLADAVRDRIDAARAGTGRPLPAAPELDAVEPILRLQEELSVLPGRNELLVEHVRTREGHHAFVFPLEGRLVHEGLAALVGHRVTRRRETSVNVAATDWGFEVMSRHPLPEDEPAWRELLATDGLLEDLLDCLDTTQLARRHFREVARIAGLINTGFPGERRPARHLQASSDLFFDVFREHDPANLLLGQAQREILDRELEVRRLRRALERAADRRLTIVRTARLSPLAFPVWADRMRAQHVTSEPWRKRIAEMIELLEAPAGIPAGGGP